MRAWTSALIPVAGLWTACTASNEKPLPAIEIQDALASSKTELPADLSGTFMFENGNPLAPRFGVLAYEVKVPLWSDGAVKSRYVFVPPASTISYDTASEGFVFPIGTTFIKHFATGDGAPVETRMIVLKSDKTWKFTTYIWKDSNVNEASSYPSTVAGQDGLDYRIPSQQECTGCHISEGLASPILGFQPRQLNFTAAGKTQSMLTELVAKDLFDQDVEKTAQVAALPDIADTNLSIDQRARSYIDVNCSTCHRPGGRAADQNMDLRFNTSFTDTGLVSLGKIVPGNATESILWQKFSAATNRMPALSIRQDPRGTEILPQWIEEMK